MSADLSTQLERYVAAVAADQEEISVAEVQPPLPVIGEVSSPPSRGRRSVGRGVVVAVAAAAVLFVLVGGVAWLTRSNGTTEPATPTTTSAPPQTTTTLIPAPLPESLNQSQTEQQIGFLAAFRHRGFFQGGCAGPEGGPSECTVQIDSPTLGGPATETFTVQEGSLTDAQEASLTDAVVREAAEAGLAALYIWALETYPDETAARCGVGFEGDDTAVAWPPGYAATSTCGEHLVDLLIEFNPAEAPVPLDPPDPGAGLWSSIDLATPKGAPPLALFDVADTPVGLLATGLDGLWISQDAVEWQPYASDSVEFDDGGFSRIAVSDPGILVANPSGDGPVHAWFSPDGQEWTLIEGLRPRYTRSGNSLTASDQRFLMIDGRPQVVSSTDGTTWQPVETLPASDFHFVAATPFGYYAADDSSLWTSPDGVEWEELPDSIDGRVNDMAGSQTDLVAVTGDGRIWHTTDGSAWMAVHTLPPGEHNCIRVGASEVGFLVVTSFDDPFDVDSAVAAAWFSEDGRVWARVTTGQGDDVPDSLSCQNEVIPYEEGFLSVTDLGGRNRPVWLYER